MVMDVNQTYCGNRFAIYTYIKSLCCTPETNTGSVTSQNIVILLNISALKINIFVNTHEYFGSVVQTEKIITGIGS